MKYLLYSLLLVAALGCSQKPQPILIKEGDFQPTKNVSDLSSLNEYEVVFSTMKKDYNSISLASDEKEAVERMVAEVAGRKMFYIRGIFIPATDVQEIKVYKLSTKGLVML